MRNEMQCNRRIVNIPTSKPLAMAYVPWQMWQNIYDIDKALCRGTIFQELDKPFTGKGGTCQ